MIKRFFLFGASGCIGFAVDCALLYLLMGFLGLYVARLISFVCAVFATWNFNRFFTFGRFESGMSRQKEFLAYFVLMLGGGMVNYAIYVALVSFSQLVGQMPIIGVAAGSIGGLLINYASSSLLYRRHQ